MKILDLFKRDLAPELPPAAPCPIMYEELIKVHEANKALLDKTVDTLDRSLDKALNRQRIAYK